MRGDDRTVVVEQDDPAIKHDQPVAGRGQFAGQHIAVLPVAGQTAPQRSEIAGVLGQLGGKLACGQPRQLTILLDCQVASHALIGIEGHKRHGQKNDGRGDEGPRENLTAQGAARQGGCSRGGRGSRSGSGRVGGLHDDPVGP